MSCNGYGHPANCNCGWGGEFHLQSNITYSSDYWQKESSYINPNAKCPVCRNRVFFYRSPNGGSVYFDELGPPWPKHRCTDNKDFIIKNKNGWRPFLDSHTMTLPFNEGTMLCDMKNSRVLFIQTKPRYFHLTPIWVSSKSRKRGEYEVSILKTKNGKTYEAKFKAYTNKAFANIEIVSMFPKTIEWFAEHFQQEEKS